MTNQTLHACPVCNLEVQRAAPQSSSDLETVTCPRCGQFAYDSELEDAELTNKSFDPLRHLLSAWIYRENRNGHVPLLTMQTWKQYDFRRMLKDCGLPKGIEEQLHALLVALADGIADSWSHHIRYGDAHLPAAVAVRGQQEVYRLVQQLADTGYLQLIASGERHKFGLPFQPDREMETYIFTAPGRKIVEQMRSGSLRAGASVPKSTAPSPVEGKRPRTSKRSQKLARTEKWFGADGSTVGQSNRANEIFLSIRTRLLEAGRTGGGTTVGLVGPSGSGKTLVAMEIANDDEIVRLFGDGIIYTNGEDKESIAREIREFISENALDEQSSEEDDVFQRLTRGRHLLICDPHREIGGDISFLLGLSRFIPILLTSSNRAMLERSRATIYQMPNNLLQMEEERLPQSSETDPKSEQSADRQVRRDEDAENGTADQPSLSQFKSGTAGYTSEYCGIGSGHEVVDHLEVDAMARRLADQIALRETKLPLAIGLFGNWGSGKSHFMNLMDKQLRSRMKEEGAGQKDSPGAWCREIVPIHFNAWHYLDANLWASLVAQIFDGLFAHLRPKPNQLQEVQVLLEQAEGATARAAEQIAVAQHETERARQDLQAAQAAQQSQESVITGMLQGLRQLLPGVTAAELERQTVAALGIHKEVKDLEDLQRLVHEVQQLGGRARRCWSAMTGPGAAMRLGWIIAAAVLVPAIIYVVGAVTPSAAVLTSATVQALSSVFAALSTVVLLGKQAVSAMSGALGQLEAWQRQAEAARRAAQDTPAVRAAQAGVAIATARVSDAERALIDARAREERLRAEMRNLSPERRLGRFIEERAQSADYRGQLGLVSLARRDFQELSALFTDSAALKDRLRKLRSTNSAAALAEADRIEELSGSIDRIVLFVDDLDRCQPDKVVDVLQAVHLLLAFPLFAVVVGVDQRCLRQSLGLQFAGLVQADRNFDKRETSDGESDPQRPWPDDQRVTPLDYLEKIFHIPFHLPNMTKEGYSQLMHSLTEPSPSAAAVDQGGHPSPAPSSSLPPVTASGGEGSTTSPVRSALSSDGKQMVLGSSPETKSVKNRVIGSVPLESWERTGLARSHALIRTPRGAKRLLNTYRLVRAGVSESRWDAFRGATQQPGDYLVVMLLLAAASGYPTLARMWFAALRTSDLDIPEMESCGPDPVAWGRLQSAFTEAFPESCARPTRVQYASWLDQVERFAF